MEYAIFHNDFKTYISNNILCIFLISSINYERLIMLAEKLVDFYNINMKITMVYEIRIVKERFINWFRIYFLQRLFIV